MYCMQADELGIQVPVTYIKCWSKKDRKIDIANTP